MQTQIVFLNKTIDPLLEVLRMLVGNHSIKPWLNALLHIAVGVWAYLAVNVKIV